MEIRPHRVIKRKKTRKIKLGTFYIGGDSPISVQSMTNTITSDHKGTIKQIKQLEMCMIAKPQTSTNTCTKPQTLETSTTWHACGTRNCDNSNQAIGNISKMAHM